MATPLSSVGIFTIDRDLRVTSWNGWMEAASGYSLDAAKDKPLGDLFPELRSGHKVDRILRMMNEGTVEVLSPPFHHYLIPCKPASASRYFQHMQQQVTIAPLRDGDHVIGGLVTIDDVTPRLEAERETAEGLASPNEITRMKTAQWLADDAASAPLIGALKDESWRVRQVAVGGLARHGGRDAIEALLRALHDEHRHPGMLNSALQVLSMMDVDVTTPLLEFLASPDAELRIYAAHALGEKNSPTAVTPLVNALRDTDTNVRFHAIESLGRLHAAEAVGPLMEIARSNDFFLAFPAVEALIHIGQPSATAPLTPLLKQDLLRGPVIRLLAKLGDDGAIEPLVSMLDDKSAALEAARALVSIFDRYERLYKGGDHIVDVIRRTITPGATSNLTSLVEGIDQSLLAPAIRILGWIEDPGADKALVQFLSQASVRRETMEALIGRGDSVTDLLVGKLSDPDLEIRRATVIALGRIGDAKAVPALLDALAEDSEIVVLAAGALAKIGDKRAFDPLLALIGHGDAAVRQAAVGALNSLGHPDLPARAKELLRNGNPRVRESAVRICGYFGYSDCFDSFLELAHDEDERVTKAAIENLPFFDDARVPAAIGKALSDEKADVRTAAARALAQVEDSDALPLLLRAISDQDPWVRYYATRSIGHHRFSDALEPLAKLVRMDTANQVRAAALEALGDIGGRRAVAILAPFVNFEQPDLSRAALQALGKISHPDALPPLLEALSASHAPRRLDAVRALGVRGGSDAVSELKHVAETEPGGDIVKAAIEALAAIASEEAIDAIVKLTIEPARYETCVAALARQSNDKINWIADGLSDTRAPVRQAVVDSLKRMRHPLASERLTAALEDGDPSIRIAAITALKDLGTRASDATLTEIARVDPDETVRQAAVRTLKGGAHERP